MEFGKEAMTDEAQNLWEMRPLPAGITLELRAGDDPALVLVRGENRVQVELAHNIDSSSARTRSSRKGIRYDDHMS